MLNRTVLLLIFLLMVAIAKAETLLAEATIAEVTERGFVLKIGSEAVPVEDESATRFWRGTARAERPAFKVGDTVGVRVKTDASPAVLREMADLPTWRWLTKLRKETLPCTLVKAEAKAITVRFEDGTTFAYRTSDKSELRLKGQVVGLNDLKEGMRLHARGRLLPSLDTWLVSLSDAAPAPAVAKAKGKTPKPKALKLAAAGKLRGVVDHHGVPFRMFDIWYQGKLLHITYNERTVFVEGGQKVPPSELRKGGGVDIVYKRDGFGRLVATKVELFTVG